jgi:hypothetical protein
MGKRLKSFVHVHDEAGETHVYGPEDDVPEEHAKLIGEHAWTDDDEDLPERRVGVVTANRGDGQPRVERPGEARRSAPRKSSAKKAAPKKAAPKVSGSSEAGDGGSSEEPPEADSSGSGD